MARGSRHLLRVGGDAPSHLLELDLVEPSRVTGLRASGCFLGVGDGQGHGAQPEVDLRSHRERGSARAPLDGPLEIGERALQVLGPQARLAADEPGPGFVGPAFLLQGSRRVDDGVFARALDLAGVRERAPGASAARIGLDRLLSPLESDAHVSRPRRLERGVRQRAGRVAVAARHAGFERRDAGAEIQRAVELELALQVAESAEQVPHLEPCLRAEVEIRRELRRDVDRARHVRDGAQGVLPPETCRRAVGPPHGDLGIERDRPRRVVLGLLGFLEGEPALSEKGPGNPAPRRELRRHELVRLLSLEVSDERAQAASREDRGHVLRVRSHQAIEDRDRGLDGGLLAQDRTDLRLDRGVVR